MLCIFSVALCGSVVNICVFKPSSPSSHPSPSLSSHRAARETVTTKLEPKNGARGAITRTAPWGRTKTNAKKAVHHRATEGHRGKAGTQSDQLKAVHHRATEGHRGKIQVRVDPGPASGRWAPSRLRDSACPRGSCGCSHRPTTNNTRECGRHPPVPRIELFGNGTGLMPSAACAARFDRAFRATTEHQSRDSGRPGMGTIGDYRFGPAPDSRRSTITWPAQSAGLKCLAARAL